MHQSEGTILVQPTSPTKPGNKSEEGYDESLTDYNMFNWLLTGAAMTSSLVFHTFLLSEGRYYKSDSDHKGMTLSLGLTIQIATYMVLSRFYTNLARKYGNRDMARFGALSYLLSCVCPLSQVPYLSNFYVCQFLSGNAFTALLSVPWKSPDGSDRTKAKASADFTSSTFLVAQFAISVMSIFMLKDFSWATGQKIISTFIFLCITLGSFFMEKQKLISQSTTRKDDGVKDLIKKSKWVSILVVLKSAQILFFGGMTTFAILCNHSWLIDYSNNEQPDRAALTISQIVLTAPVILSRLFAKFLDRDNEGLIVNLSIISCVNSAIVWIFVYFFGLGMNWQAYLAAFISAVGGTGLFIISDNITRRYITPIEKANAEEYLRSVNLIPMMVLVLICGLAYDYWMKEAPLLIIGTILVGCGFLVIKTTDFAGVADKIR